MQNCSKCSTELNESNAYKKGNRYQSLCKSCFTDYVSQRWVKRKLEAVQSKGGKCQCCGYDKYHGALEFHHLDPKEKDFDWRKTRQMSKTKLQDELDKCVLLCANCHREVHAGIASVA